MIPIFIFRLPPQVNSSLILVLDLFQHETGKEGRYTWKMTVLNWLIYKLLKEFYFDDENHAWKICLCNNDA